MSRQEQRMIILREVAQYADNKVFYAKAEELGEKAARALTRSKRSQITGLEAVANSALKTSDVFDFIKTRTARHKEWHSWGPGLLKYLSCELGKQRQEICGTLNLKSQSPEGLRVHLLLIRELVRQLSAHYEYACEFPEQGVTNECTSNTGTAKPNSIVE